MAKRVEWLVGTFETPPFSDKGREKAGTTLRAIQNGEDVRGKVVVGSVREFRVNDPEAGKHWRVFYAVETDVVVVVDWFDKDSQRTPKAVKGRAEKRFKQWKQGR